MLSGPITPILTRQAGLGCQILWSSLLLSCRSPEIQRGIKFHGRDVTYGRFPLKCSFPRVFLLLPFFLLFFSLFFVFRSPVKMSAKADYEKNIPDDGADIRAEPISSTASGLHRRLANRQIQLIAIGGSIGTAVFVSIGAALAKGGPGSLFIAYTIYCCFLAMVTNCLTEMSVYMPVSGGFIRLAGKWVDDAWGFTAGWNFFLYEAILIPFEITAISLVMSYWRDDIPAAAVCGACVFLYGYVLTPFVGYSLPLLT